MDESVTETLIAATTKRYASGARRNFVQLAKEYLTESPIKVVIEATCCDHPTIRRIAASCLNQRQSEFAPEHLECVWELPKENHLLLRTASAFELPSISRDVATQPLALAENEDPDVRRSACEWIVRQQPSLIPKLVEVFRRTADTVLARTLCLHAPRQSVNALADLYLRSVSKNRLTVPLAGIAVTPHLLASLWRQKEPDARKLAVDFGYIEADAGCPLDGLEAGLWFVNAAIASDLDEASRRVNELCWYLLARLSRSQDAKLPDFDHTRSLDKALLIAAVRRLDHDNLDAARNASPLERADPLFDVLQFAHSPQRLNAKGLLDEPLAEATSMGLTSELTSQYLLDNAACQIERDADMRTESTLFLKARYELAAREGRVPGDVRTDGGSRRLPDAVRLVRSENEDSPPAIEELSPGARAVRRLIWDFEGTDSGQELLEHEAKVRDRLLPIGVEVQIPNVPAITHVAWKEAFRSAGIPSPRRPECGTMLEAAIPPAASSRATIQFLHALGRYRIVGEEQDLGIHVSIQGDLGPAARCLAYVQLFLNDPVDRSPKPSHGQRLVMSKGLLCLNDDTTRCWWNTRSNQRTELRTFIAAVRLDGAEVTVDENALRAIKETHLLASALGSSEPTMRNHFDVFAESVAAITRTMPPAFQNLLNANFYESTGDYRDGQLHESLPIFRLRQAARDQAKDSTHMRSFCDKLRLCRTKFAECVEEGLG